MGKETNTNLLKDHEKKLAQMRVENVKLLDRIIILERGIEAFKDNVTQDIQNIVKFLKERK